MSDELRRAYHDRIAAVRAELSSSADAVAGAVIPVTEALLRGDRASAESIERGDVEIDARQARIEAEIFDLIARQGPFGRDLRLLVASLRIAQEVERSGDLLASVARRVGRLTPADLTAERTDLILAMGREAGAMFAGAAGAYAALDLDTAVGVRDRDDVLDELHARLLRELFSTSSGSYRAVVELGFVGRFLERVGDHAVVIAERVRFVASGRMDPLDRDSA